MQDYLDDKLVKEIRDHALEEYPNECCGLIISKGKHLQYIKARNVYDKPKESFVINPRDYARASDIGKIEYIVHSHPDTTCEPSIIDLDSCEKSKIPWLIISIPDENIKVIRPSGFILPLEGRTFLHGIVDCYTLIRDYYDQVLDIQIPDYERRDNWWLSGENMYVDNFKDAGFVEVNNIQEHDVIIMKVMASIPNHGAIYIGDDLIFHHLVKRLSRKEVYGDYWRKNTAHIVRHKSLC